MHNFLELLLGYERNVEGGLKLKALPLTGNVSRSRGKIARGIIRASESLLASLSYSSTRGYGLFLMSFGLFSFVLHALSNYIGGADMPLYVIISSVVLLILGIPLVCFDKPLAIAMQEFRLTDVIFFEFFCIKRMHRINSGAATPYKREGERIYLIKPMLWLSLGLLLAAFTMLMPMWWLLLGIGVAIYLFLTFVSPEFSFLAIIVAMPYLPVFRYSDFILAGAVLATFISFTVKVALGKRVYYFEQYDMLLGLFLALVLVSGVFVKGVSSFTSSLIVILLAMGYVLTSSLISNRRLADCVIDALVISPVPVSINAVVLGAKEIGANGYRGFQGVSATFETPSALAVYLLVVSVFVLYRVRVSRHTLTKAFHSLVFILNFAALICTASTWAFVAGVFGFVAYCFTGIRKSGPLLNGILSLLPYSLLFVGDKVLIALDRVPVLSAVRFGELARRWEASFAMLSNNLLVGIGIGSDSFSRELSDYSSESFTDSGNFLLEIGCEAGVLALSAFILMIVVRVCHRMAYRRYSKGSAVYHLTNFSTVAMTVLIVFGAVNYLWSDLTLNYLYWVTFGIGSAVLRVAKREHDDRVAYYSDGRSSDSSSIDVEL